jgi:hypothetical protein
LSRVFADAGRVLILSMERWQSATSCVGVGVGPVACATLGLVVRLVVFVLGDDLPHPANNAAPRTASSSNADSLRIIAAS